MVGEALEAAEAELTEVGDDPERNRAEDRATAKRTFIALPQ
jgi:hypothetical protein